MTEHTPESGAPRCGAAHPSLPETVCLITAQHRGDHVSILRTWPNVTSPAKVVRP